jgi:hypothetical protein
MDTLVYKDWVREVLCPYFNDRPGLLIQDNFSDHLASASINSVNNIGINLEFIPAGYASTAMDHQPSTKGQTNLSRCHSVGTSSMGQRHS